MASCDMPLDIIFLILLWLPMSSLLRFKSVSKSWFSLIQSSDFVYRHLGFTSHTKLVLGSEQHFSLLSIHNTTATDDEQLLLDFPIIHDPYHCFPTELVASCNGIICLRRNRRVCLWNPATKQSFNLPPLPQLPILCHLGFGFDVSTHDYKVVYLLPGKLRDFTAHIYTTSSNSWTTINPPCIHHDIFDNLKTPYHAGIYCWWGHSILSFDFSTEVFETIPFPECLSCYARCTLFILRDNIACISGDDTYEIWMLSDYNFKDSWTKLYSIEFSSIFYWMTWFSNNSGEFLLFHDHTHLCSYNVVTQEIVNHQVHVAFGYQVATYEESLVSLRGASSQDQRQTMLINQSVTEICNNSGDIYIPQVLVFRILLRLPVVTLLRFKSACKSWCSLIKSSNFVAQHLLLHQNDTDNINFILHNCSAECAPTYKSSSHPSSPTSHTTLLSTNKFELLDLPYFKDWYPELVIIVASFDGIICIRVTMLFDLYLWNPATKQFKVVPVEWAGLFSYSDAEFFHIGFGYDVNTDEYKLVRFHNEDDFDTPKVEIFSLSTDSWRTVNIVLPAFEAIDSILQAPYRSGINHWLATIDPTSMILSFDFTNEVFGTIELPDSIKSDFLLKLDVVRENLACVAIDRKCHLEKEKDWQCEIWVMTEYGVKESWNKLYVVGPFSPNWHIPKVYSKKNGDHVVLHKDEQLYEYNIVTQEAQQLSVQAPLSYGYGHHYQTQYQVVAYKESLVPIERGQG